MRSPINQVPINGTSVNVWVEAAVSSSGAAAFGIAVRKIKPTATSAGTAQATVSVDRTAYPTLPAYANEAWVVVDVLRTANVRMAPLVARAAMGLTATRYANVRLSEPTPNVAEATLPDNAVTVYAVVHARRAQGRATTWVPRNGVRVIKTRLQKLTSTRTATAEIRMLPNTIIGRGITQGASTSHTLPDAWHIQHAVKGKMQVAGASQAGVYRRTQFAEGVLVGEAQADIGPTITRNGVRYSYNHAKALGRSVVQLTPLKRTSVPFLSGSGKSELVLEIFRVQKVSGAGTGDAESQGFFGKHHVHKPTGRMQVSSFSFLGSQQYRLIWGEAVCAPVARLEEKFAHLRWVGMSAVCLPKALQTNKFWRDIPLSGELRGMANSGASNKIKRHFNEALTAEVVDNVIGVRNAFTSGSCSSEALYGPSAGSRAVRWVGHGHKDFITSIATSRGERLRRYVPARSAAYAINGVTQAEPVRQRLVAGVSQVSAATANVIAPHRTANLLPSKVTGEGGTTLSNSKLEIYHIREFGAVTLSGVCIHNSVAVKWVNHASKQVSLGQATGIGGNPLVYRPALLEVCEPEGESEAVGVKQRLMESAVDTNGNGVITFEPLRIAILHQSKANGVSQVPMSEQEVTVLHWVFLPFLFTKQARTTGQGLRITRLAIQPALQGNAASFSATFKINADAPASYSRQIILPWVDRGMFVPATDREYRV